MTTKKGPITKATANAAEKADELLVKSTDVYTDAKETAAAKYSDVKKNAAAKYSDAKDAAAIQYNAAKTKAVETRENTKVYVQENPEKSIGIAAGVGALIGAVIALIITRRR